MEWSEVEWDIKIMRHVHRFRVDLGIIWTRELIAVFSLVLGLWYRCWLHPLFFYFRFGLGSIQPL